MGTGGHAELTKDAGVITEVGMNLLARVGLDVDALATTHGKRSTKGWLCGINGARSVRTKRKGRQVFRDTFGARLG